MKTPIVLIIFNRPDITERVFSEIAKAKPPKLFVIADGPRLGQSSDEENCAATRAIIEHVDWKCEVLKNYSDVNLGCGRRPATGISWVFEQVEEAIILEDDCVPHPTFFRFCEELLERYRDDERVMMIGGRNNFAHIHTTPYSYSFWHDMSNWGWATWRRAWQHYDIEIKLWPALCDTSWLLDMVGDSRLVQYWQSIFDKAHAAQGSVDYWDYQWTFACWAHNGLAAVSNVNLIHNIGFGEDATHTKSINDSRVNVPIGEMVFPLRHPPDVVRDREVDRLIIQFILEEILEVKQQQQGLYRRLRRKLSAAIPKSFRKQISYL